MTDPLTRFLAGLEDQVLATFVNARPLVQQLIDFDDVFVMRATRMFEASKMNEAGTALLAVRALSLQRAAARLVMSGHVYESKVVLRALLESALYAWALSTDAHTRDVWEHRDDSDATKQAARDLFTWNKLKSRLRNASPAISREVADLYDRLIDFGAHPNIGGIVDASWIERTPDGQLRIMTAFMTGNPDLLERGLRELIRVTKCSFEVLILAFPEKAAALDLIDPVRAILQREVAMDMNDLEAKPDSPQQGVAPARILPMSHDTTPERARKETIGNLVGLANSYRVGTGAHTVVINEINRREDWRKRWRILFFAILTALVGLAFFLMRG
jgi:hypothetical protein